MVVMPDAGLSLVTWRVMYTQPQLLEMDQRQQIFRSRCIIKGRVCYLIIDEGSCSNVASSTLIEKLSLSTQDHPNPYKLRWLNKRAEVRVDKQCLVFFSISKNYSDEALCDVQPMDACHLLLGRSWGFDRYSVHYGKDNSYTFKFGKKKVILTHLLLALKYTIPPSMLEPSRKVLLINEAEMIHELKSEYDVYVLVAKDVFGGQKMSLLNEVQELIKSCEEVFPNELPSGLPPLRGIEHQIDFITGATLLNKVAYRSDPKAIQELQHQIRELMNKGFVRFTISRLDDILDEFSGVKLFFKIDLRQGYHQVRIKEGDEWKTTFNTKRGVYECLVVPIGLSNASSTFMRLMVEVLRHHLGRFVVVYFDDILVYSPSKEEHLKNLQVLFVV
ncbi:uncharacterized protein LOC141600702 [Silene latifolia]|uniref:uncharacterized protein LOC141600702 n=1 Tax=Silene latifolia TaxID=37657 RepID=UPI003D776D59